VTAGNGNGVASNGTYDFNVLRQSGNADQNLALQAARDVIRLSYPDVAFDEPPNIQEPDEFGVVQMGSSWVGTFTDGRPAAGAMDVFYDPATGNSFVIMRSWFLVGPGDLTEPNGPEGSFMFRSFFDSFTTIP
jgi:hypothetical protein